MRVLLSRALLLKAEMPDLRENRCHGCVEDMGRQLRDAVEAITYAAMLWTALQYEQEQNSHPAILHRRFICAVRHRSLSSR